MEQLKVRSISETANIKAELSAVRKVSERAYHERYEVSNLQSKVDGMQTEMIKTDRLGMWGKYMEGFIAMVLYILDDLMRKLYIG